MTTLIGQRLREAPGRLVAGVAVGIVVVVADLLLFWHWNCDRADQGRALLGLVVLLVYAELAKGDLPSVGLSAIPTQGWPYWLLVATVLAVSVGAVAIPLGMAWWALGWPLDDVFYPEPITVDGITNSCVRAPVFEELIYRVGLCVPAAAVLGPRAAILLSGVALGVLHVIYGNAQPATSLPGSSWPGRS